MDEASAATMSNTMQLDSMALANSATTASVIDEATDSMINQTLVFDGQTLEDQPSIMNSFTRGSWC